MAFVLDASVAIAWFVKSQATEYTYALLRRAAAERLHVPALWHAEFANVLLAALARRFSLSAYDATYLELALRLALPIAARDGPLCKAAPRAGVAIA